MAAHVLTGINHIRHDLEDLHLNLFDHLDTALVISCWTEDLEFEHYCELSRIVALRDEDQLYEWLDRMTPIYKSMWEDLGQPRTREEWLMRKSQRATEEE